MKVRGIVGGFTTCAAHSFVFIVVKTYPLLCHGVVSIYIVDLYSITDLLNDDIIPVYRKDMVLS